VAKHKFGGPDTIKKLDCLADYLEAFSIALRDQKFSRIYIDAFAGSGDRTEIRASLPLFGSDHAEPLEVTTPGSARIAVSIDPPLNKIVLVEKNESRYSELDKIRYQYKVVTQYAGSTATSR
jgi:three-Cys-motif partner protein